MLSWIYYFHILLKSLQELTFICVVKKITENQILLLETTCFGKELKVGLG